MQNEDANAVVIRKVANNLKDAILKSYPIDAKTTVAVARLRSCSRTYGSISFIINTSGGVSGNSPSSGGASAASAMRPACVIG